MHKIHLLSTVAALMLSIICTAETKAQESLVLVDTIDVHSDKGLGAFDISFVDPLRGLYILSDRTNASIDIFNAHDNSFIGRVGGFKGVVTVNGTVNNDLSGPDGNVVVGHREIWAGDGDSTLKVINIDTMKVVDTVSTGGQFRCDEMDWDAADHLLTVANDADTPPFISLINTDTHKVVAKIPFDGSNGAPNATAGIEQPKWSPRTGLLYTSVPQIGSDTSNGGLAVIDPVARKVIKVYPVSNCSPAGLALGPRDQALLGCSASFGTAPNVLTQSVVINIITGAVVASIPQVGGSDEVWYDRASGHYYLAARSNEDASGKVTPVIGTINGGSNTFVGNIPASTSSHSIAADSVSLHVFVPAGFPAAGASDPGNPCPDISKGCIAVYVPSTVNRPEYAHR